MLEDLVATYVHVENKVMIAASVGWALGMINGLLVASVALWKGWHRHDADQ